jgi:hypothetical protein
MFLPGTDYNYNDNKPMERTRMDWGAYHRRDIEHCHWGCYDTDDFHCGSVDTWDYQSSGPDHGADHFYERKC